MVDTDPAAIQSYAEALYAKAKSVHLTYVTIGALLGAFAGVWLGAFILGLPLGFILALPGAALCGWGGWSRASIRAAVLRGQAQVALAQVQARGSASSSGD